MSFICSVEANKPPSIDEMMQKMPEYWRYRWCEATGACGCMGAANCSGGLYGVTKSDWQSWVNENPDPHPMKPFDTEKFGKLIIEMCKDK